MDQIDIVKIERIIKDREQAHDFLLKRNSKSYDSFLELKKNAYASNRLERKYKELIALGISIIQNCESCIEWHVHQAIEFGASFDEIFEAVDVGIEMGGGPATVSTRFVIKVIEYYKNRMIKELRSEQDFIECTEVIQNSFKSQQCSDSSIKFSITGIKRICWQGYYFLWTVSSWQNSRLHWH
jgi:AhpD family alkylhydroperoxidase